jgi:hypothetical protein
MNINVYKTIWNISAVLTPHKISLMKFSVTFRIFRCLRDFLTTLRSPSLLLVLKSIFKSKLSVTI